jgi:hypothetical protein
MWFVLLWGILTSVGSASYLLTHWDMAVSLLSPEEMIRALVIPGVALAGSILAFCMRRQSVALVAVYFLLYAIVVWQMSAPRPWSLIAFHVVLWGAVFAYLAWLLRLKRLR